MEKTEINAKIMELVQEINPYEEINESSRLIEEAILDSLTLVILINEIEEFFNVKLPEDKLKPENFENISEIAEMVEKILKK